MNADARLTPRAQGFNDVVWCGVNERAVIINDNACPSCLSGMMKPSDLRLDKVFMSHQFLGHVHKGDAVNAMEVIAETVKGTDDAEAEIEVLRGAISGFGQQIHQAYHGAHPPDLSDVNHLECPRGLCRSVQHVLDPKRPRGMP